ncbi:MAG TPA: hypothetical protein VMF67_12745 [Rhizomicrobium sp.]|nr:hypothetical protein [Rhizomicrobium sp.]
MGENVLVDAAFLAALLIPRDSHHDWAVAQSARHGRPWQTCEAALSETSYLLGARGTPKLIELLRRRLVVPSFAFADNCDGVLDLMHKYSDVPISLADACLVRMTEILSNPMVLTADSDFRVYRRHGRRVIPLVAPWT